MSRRLVPAMETEEDFRRFFHRDVRLVDDASVWAERNKIEDRLADDIFCAKRDRIFWHSPEGEPISQYTWLRQRWERLVAESKRRATGEAQP